MVGMSIRSGRSEDTLERSEEGLKPPSLLRQRHIRILLFIDGLYSFTYSGFTLWFLSTAAKGGLDWSTAQIGQVLLPCGAMVIVFNMLVLPSLAPRLGMKTFSRLGSVFEVPLYFVLPLLSWVNSAGHPVAFASLILRFMMAVCSNSFYLGIALALNEANRRGELKGISMAVDSFASAISSIVLSVLFAFSIDFNHPFPFDYYLVFYHLRTMRFTVGCLAWNHISGLQDTDKHVRLPDEYPSSPRLQCNEGIELGIQRLGAPMRTEALAKG